MKEWSGILDLSERTLQRYKKDKRAFDTLQSEKIVQVTLLIRYGREVFGDEKKFNLWLNAENLSLGNVRPKELLDSSFGIDLLKDELTRIEHGILA
jgi:putative toxin-antitoxin system antitoxin component (TIGR02293 family)